MRLRHTIQMARTLTLIIPIVSAMTRPALGDVLPYRPDWEQGRGVDRSAGESIDFGSEGVLTGAQDGAGSTPMGEPGRKKDRGWQTATNQDDPNEFNRLYGMNGATLGGDESWDGGGDGLGRDADNGVSGVTFFLMQPDPDSSHDHALATSVSEVNGWSNQEPVIAVHRAPDSPVPAPGPATVIGLCATGLLCCRAGRTLKKRPCVQRHEA